MIDVKISIGELFTMEEVTKNGSLDYKIAVMPEVGQRIQLSDTKLTSASNIMRNRLKSGYNYVNCVIFSDSGTPIIMLGRNPSLLPIDVSYKGTVSRFYVSALPKQGEWIFFGNTQAFDIKQACVVNVFHKASTNVVFIEVSKDRASLPVRIANGTLPVHVENSSLEVCASLSDRTIPVEIKEISVGLDALPVQLKEVNNRLSVPVMIESIDYSLKALPVEVKNYTLDVKVTNSGY